MGALRNFCRNASPFRCRNGLLVLPKEVARSDIVRSRQITLMALPCLERTHAVVLRVSCDRTRAAVGKLRRVPGADATKANAAPMRLVLHHLLDILGPPVMQPLPLGAPFSTRKIAVLHDDDVNLNSFASFTMKFAVLTAMSILTTFNPSASRMQSLSCLSSVNFGSRCLSMISMKKSTALRYTSTVSSKTRQKLRRRTE